MSPTVRYYILLSLQVSAYFLASRVIFNNVYKTTHTVIDEHFHIPQGILYCTGNFSYWDPKITTLPGLYLVSAVIGFFGECNTYNLRLVNLIASCVNLLLFSSILRFVYYGDRNPMKLILQALNLTILPPLYFLSHIYYTDVLSVTFILMFSRLCFTNKDMLKIFFCGIFAITVRQTNVVWVAMVFGHKLLDLLIKSSKVFGNQYINEVKLSKRSMIAKDIDKSKLKRYYGMWDVYCAAKYHLSTGFSTFVQFLSFFDVMVLLTYMIILNGFITFVHFNGSIAVGDKTAHTATIHLPQLLYFLVFYGVFGLPYVISRLFTTLELMWREKILVLLCGVIFTLVVHHNTLVHPYLLADNRHFTFYIWNRWYGKYDHAIYTMVPIYIFLLFSLYDNLKDQNCISFLLPYAICLVPALALQKLIEIRYFLMPYIILRLRFARPSFPIVMSEFLWYLIINFAAFYVFFDRQIIWKDFDYAQRIMW